MTSQKMLAGLILSGAMFSGANFRGQPGWPASIGHLFTWAKRAGYIEWALPGNTSGPMEWRGTEAGHRWAASFVATLRVNEVYDRLTVQGEGPYAGRLCTFVRLYGCNLSCRWCDTAYTWDTTGKNGTVYPVSEERHDMTVDEVAEAVVKLNAPLCVISGGEPMLQITAVEELARLLWHQGCDTHIETNGTRPPPPATFIQHFTVSPKLPSADAGPVDRVLNLSVLRAWAQRDDTCFKTVVATPQEVHDAFLLYESIDVPERNRWVMPQTAPDRPLQAALCDVTDCAVRLRLNVSSRLHVAVWGLERGR